MALVGTREAHQHGDMEAITGVGEDWKRYSHTQPLPCLSSHAEAPSPTMSSHHVCDPATIVERPLPLHPPFHAQFSRPGWRYLVSDSARGGSGRLRLGGSYVTLVDAATGDFSIVIEKMSHDGSACVRPGLAPFLAATETATFTLGGGLAGVTVLQLWRTHWAGSDADPEPTVEFQRLPPVAVIGGIFTLNLTADSMYTLTTLTSGGKGAFGTPPPPVLFPATHTDDFEACVITSEAPYFSDQSGALECVDSGDAAHGVVMQQMTPLKPVPSGGDVLPYSFIGARDARDLSLVIDARVLRPGDSVMLGVRAQGYQVR